MANRRPQQNNGRRMEFGRNDRGKSFGRSGVSPWQGGAPAGGGLPALLPLGHGSTEATLALASNIINLLQPRQNPVPSLLDMPIRRDFGPNMGRFDRGFPNNRMGNQNFRRTGNYNRSGERVNNNRKPFRPNDGQRPPNKSTPKKEADSKAKPVKESDDAGQEVKVEQDKEQHEAEKKEESSGEDKKEALKTRYDDINSALLRCHICNKGMWDGRSFENHLSGRAHAIMMQKTAESYALTADTMRQEFKIREMKRTRKSGGSIPRDFYCAMCDMYAADGAAHRTTVGHRKLKKYLHPSCTCCRKEMPTRIELDEHRLTAEHLRNMQDKQEIITKPKPEVMVISTLSMEKSYLRDDRTRRRRDAGPSARPEQQDAQEGEEIKKETEEEGAEEKQDEEDKKKYDDENVVLDYKEGDDLSNVKYPAYSVERGVGRSFLSAFRCVQCSLCRKLLDGDDTADVHLRTWRHHQLFLRLINEKSAKQQAAAEESASDGNKRPSTSEQSGNFKRRKTSPDDDSDLDQNGHDDDITMKEEPEPEVEGEGDLPPPEELEDWEQSVDEILQDEATEKEEAKEEKEEEVQPQEEAPAPAQPKPSPRGRGRGRRRY